MNGLKLTFELQRNEAVFGESVPFAVTLTHTFKSPVLVNALDPVNRALKVFMRRLDGEERTADQMTPILRDGLSRGAPVVPGGVRLIPGQKLEFKDDLLRWFAHIPAGTYRVWAEYEGLLRTAASEPAELRISPALILAANTPRWGLQMPDAPYAAAWAHRHERGIMLFYQLQSPDLPRNPVRSIRAGVIGEQVSAHAACLPGGENLVGHLYWFTVKERFFFVPFDVKNGVTGPAVEVKKLPFKGWPIPSGLSLKDGSFLVPFTDHRRTKVALMHVFPNGEASAVILDLEKNSPLGPHMSFFEYDRRLHFIWTKAKGRQIDYAMLPLDDMESGFAARTIHIANDPVLWFDAYLDRGMNILQLKSLYLGDPPPSGEQEGEEPLARVMAWCITSKDRQIVCTPISATDSSMGRPVSFQTGSAGDVSVLGSVTTSKGGLALLLVNGNGRIFYASTMRRRLMPIEDAVGIPVTQANCPSLMRGSRYPWVHLRFITDARMISYVRLEPVSEFDPVESETRPLDLVSDEWTEVTDETEGRSQSE